MNPLHQLMQYGQAYWIDNLTRGMIASGELTSRVSEGGLRGVTSNPAIFHKAISGSTDYDAQIRELVGAGMPIPEIYERLVVSDIQQACDVLRSVYDHTDGVDGYVSLEVSPYLAYDTAGTLQEVRRLWHAVDRPNLFIKIPGTAAGVPAIEDMLYEGLNINITLLFSISAYEAVAHAYIRALERRLAEGKPLRQVASVASFFLSRIDVLVDQLLGHRIQPSVTRGDGPRPEQLLGKVAIASAKLAYQRFKDLFSGQRWQALAAAGARVQRPLWASTSTKDPLYYDVRYVEPLIGPHTVNTMPNDTIDAFADHGVVKENTVEADLTAAQRTFDELKRVGIDLDCVTWQLQNEGVQKFIDPFDQLMTTLADKRQQFLGAKVSHQRMDLGKRKSALTSAFGALNERQFGRRLFAPDPLLWTADARQAEAIREQLRWLNDRELWRSRVGELTAFATDIKDADVSSVVLLGASPSGLCPTVCRELFGTAPGWPQLVVVDSTDPEAVKAVKARIDLAKTLFVLSSKSGDAHTSAVYRDLYARVGERTGGNAGKQFVAIADPGAPLLEEARRQGFRYCFENPAVVGSRYSALSYDGLIPIALLGVDIAVWLEGVHQMWVSCGPFIPAEANPGVSLGTLLGIAGRRGHAKVTFVLGKPIRAFGDWLESLVVESLGGNGHGLTSEVIEALGMPGTSKDDRIFVDVRLAKDDDVATGQQLTALAEAGFPVVRITLPELIDIGGEFLRWHIAIATAGAIMGINPFEATTLSDPRPHR